MKEEETDNVTRKKQDMQVFVKTAGSSKGPAQDGLSKW